jgi:hypothetical protein
MARTNAMSIYLEDGVTLASLQEVYNGVLDNVSKMALSSQLKNQNFSGNPMAGSVEIKRFVNSVVKAYGTARTAGEADKLNAEAITVNINTPKEIVEEFEAWDVEQYGIANLVSRRSGTYTDSMVRFMDSLFFAQAEADGTEVTLTGSTDVEKLEELIQALETVSNDYVDGVDRDLISVSLKPSVYGALRNYIDTLPNPVDGGVAVNRFHGVRVYSNHRQTEDAIAMVDGSIAMPVSITGVKVSDIDMSVAVSAGLFFKYGLKTIMPDLIVYADFTPVVSA